MYAYHSGGTGSKINKLYIYIYIYIPFHSTLESLELKILSLSQILWSMARNAESLGSSLHDSKIQPGLESTSLELGNTKCSCCISRELVRKMFS
jgi:hypothetical protein